MKEPTQNICHECAIDKFNGTPFDHATTCRIMICYYCGVKKSTFPPRHFRPYGVKDEHK